MRTRTTLIAFLVATLSALLVRLFLIEDFRIASNSMDPSLLTGDLVFVSKYNFNVRLPFSNYEVLTFRRPQRGEVVAFTLPGQGMGAYVKRVVALAGDEVEISDGTLKVNGTAARYESAGGGEYRENLFDVEYLVKWEREKSLNYGPVVVPVDHFFTLGDNRGDSEDSRVWGPIPYSCLKGRVSMIWASSARVGSGEKIEWGFG